MDLLGSKKGNRPGQHHAELAKGPHIYAFYFHLQISITQVNSIPHDNHTLLQNQTQDKTLLSNHLSLALNHEPNEHINAA
jgi:hypothetical protein